MNSLTFILCISIQKLILNLFSCRKYLEDEIIIKMIKSTCKITQHPLFKVFKCYEVYFNLINFKPFFIFSVQDNANPFVHTVNY